MLGTLNRADKMISGGRLKHWSLLLTKFLAGQGFVQALNLLTGFLILRFLPVHEYALYIVSSLLLAIGSVGSDMGISQGLVSIGARIKDDKPALSSLFATALAYRRWLFIITTIIVIGLSPFITKGHNWAIASIALSIIIVIITNWFQQTVSLNSATLNIFHDATGLLHTGLAGAFVRLVLVMTLCRTIPTAAVSLAINCIGFIVGNLLLSRRCALYIQGGAVTKPCYAHEIRNFIYPLIPGSIYYIFQSQISTGILSFFGYTTAVAQIGALGRLGQVLGLFMLLNSFFVHPHFSRLEDKRDFVARGLLLLAGCMAISVLIMASAFIVPEWWLLILGRKYAGLNRELPLALLVPLLVFLSSILYTMCIARKFTRWQFWTIPTGLIIQILFIAINGVKSTYDALMLGVLLAVGNLVVQSVLLGRVLYAWDLTVKKIQLSAVAK